MAATPTDARATALAVYLRERASAFSMSADVHDEQHIAGAGMALLDAAKLAERLMAQDPRLVALSEAGRFETMPNSTARFLETPALRAAMQRPLAGSPLSGSDILALVVDTAREDTAPDDPAPDDPAPDDPAPDDPAPDDTALDDTARDE